MLLLKLLDLSAGEDSGIPSVAVECVDIRRNISGEGDYLDSQGVFTPSVSQLTQ